MQGIVFRNRAIWLLTTLLLALFSINKTNITGSYFLLAISIIIFFIDYKKPGGYFNFLFGKFQLHVFLFSCFCFASVFWAINAADCIEKGITIISILICMSILIRHYRYRNNGVGLLLKSIMWGGMIVALYTFFFTGISSVTSTVEDGGRMDSTFDNVNDIAFFCAISIIIAFYYFIFQKETTYIVFSVPTLFILAGASSRTAFVVLFLGIVSLLFIKNVKFKNAQSFLRLICVCILLILFIRVLITLPIFSGVMTRMEGVTNLLSGEGDVDHSTLLRQEYALIGLSLFLENPIVGIGMGNAHIVNLNTTGHDAYLHNNFIELLASGGIIGFLLFYFIEFYIIFKIIKMRYYNSSQGKLLLILLFCFLLEDFGTVSYYSKFLYFFLMVCYLFIENENKLLKKTN